MLQILQGWFRFWLCLPGELTTAGFHPFGCQFFTQDIFKFNLYLKTRVYQQTNKQKPTRPSQKLSCGASVWSWMHITHTTRNNDWNFWAHKFPGKVSSWAGNRNYVKINSPVERNKSYCSMYQQHSYSCVRAECFISSLHVWSRSSYTHKIHTIIQQRSPASTYVFVFRLNFAWYVGLFLIRLILAVWLTRRP